MAIIAHLRNHHRCDKGHKWATWSGRLKACTHHPCPKCSLKEWKRKQRKLADSADAPGASTDSPESEAPSPRA